MPSNPSILAEKLTRKFISLDLTRQKVELLYSRGQIVLRDKRQFYEGLFLKTHVLFENFIEELFYGLLVKNSSIVTPSSIIPKIEIKSHLIAREIIELGRNYVDWIPYEKTLNLASLFFRGGKPFALLNPNERDDILKVNIIRNVLAHESRYSHERFERHVLGTSPIPTSERKPADYLMGIYRIHPRQTRYELYAVKLSQIANKLTS
jgi:hypothetical protein